MTVIVRFAPSPTGLLHLGNARMAIMNHLFAAKQNGTFILRIDDTDQARSRQEYEDAIHEDLAWLGIEWQREEKQSLRTERYTAAVEALKASGRLYDCWETAEELDYKRRRQRARGLPPVYDRAGLALTDAEREAFRAEGRAPHWRFRLEEKTESWTDLAHGDVKVDCGSVSDPVLVRADGTLLYTLPSVVDDLEMGVTHVIRGEDHLTNSAAQCQLARALLAAGIGGSGASEDVPFAFAHLPLVSGPDGGPLSKRDGSLALTDLRKEGIEPMAIASLLSALGTSHAPDPTGSLADLAGQFDIGGYGKAPPRLDPDDLTRLTARRLHTLSYADVAERLQAFGSDGGEGFWEAVRPNLSVLADARDWYSVIEGPIETPKDLSEDDVSYLAQALATLPAEPWDDEVWGAWTGALKTATGRKGKALFMPLRLALTGMQRGPDMAVLLSLIGRGRAKERLSAAIGDTSA